MQDDGNAQPSCADLRSDVESSVVKKDPRKMTSYDGSPLVSGQSGLATSGDGVEAQICQASSQNSAQSDPILKAHDYIGLSEVSSRAVGAEQSAMHEEQRQMVAGQRLNLNLQETELRLGPPKPAAVVVEVGSPFQPKQGSVHAAMDGKEAEVLNAALGQPSVMGGPTNHASFQKIFRPCEKGQKEIIPSTYVKELEDGALQKMFGRSESFKRRYAEDNVQVWDIGIGLSPQIMTYPQEEVGENKVSCSGGRMLKTSTLDSQEQFTKQQEKIQQVLAPLEPCEDEQKPLPPKSASHPQQDVEIARQKQLLHGSALGPAEYGVFGHEAHGSPHLEELTAAHRFWQAQMMLRAADGAHFPRNYEPQSPHFSQDLETSKPSFGRTLNGVTAARVMPTIPRNTTAGAKRVFSEAIGNDAVVLNGNAKVANSGVMGAAESESKAFNQQLKQQLSSSIFSWSPAKQPLASWPLGLECQSGAAFGPFPSPGQSLIKGDANILPKEYHFEAPPEKSSAIGRRPQSEPKRGLQDAQNTAEVNNKATAPRAPVGWPPVQSFRKNSLPPPKPKKLVESEASPTVAASSTLTPVPTQSECLFVKVYMDGLPIGRKVDLRIYDTYDKLSMALEEMFKGFINGQCGGKDKENALSTKGKKLNFLCNSDYVITYEDKDGDLMLVGDVPWGMFIVTVKRLRIMKGSEAIGLAPRPLDKVKC